MQTILMLGGSGFIGTNLTEYLCDNDYRVISFGRSASSIDHVNFKNVVGDVLNLQELESVFQENKIDCVFHCLTSVSATDSIGSCQELIAVNLSAFIDTVSLMRKYQVRNIVYISSGGSIYGVSDEPLKEEHELAPVSFYGWLKESCESYLGYEARINPDFNYLILRPANVYGRYQKFNRIIGVTLQKALLKEPLHIYGDINICKDYIHIDDVSEIIHKLVTIPNSWNNIYNIGSGQGTSLREIIQYAEEITGEKINVMLHEQMAGDVRYSILNVNKIKELTGKSTYISVYDGMEDMQKYVSSQIKIPSKS